MIPDSELINNSVVEEIESLLHILSEKERKVIRLFYGLGNEDKMTLDAIGRKFGFSRERARQIKIKSLRLLRSKSKNIQ
ncbi:MAG: RNA polymerase subunit sigma, partial [Chloroflexi bacterium]|nr:RNA polymerase subunit sigma [Chloroflexota bacterium]